MLDPLFHPSSIAIIGASNDPSKAGGRLLKSLIDGPYEGRLYPVNPKAPEVMGVKCYPTTRDITEEIDLVIVNIPFQFTLEAISDCAAKGVKYAIIHTAGFGETGQAGRELEKKIVETALSGGTRLVGPNCMGIFSPDAGINMIVPHFEAAEPHELKGSVTFFGQSGWGSETFIIEGWERGLGFSKVISIGNQCDIAAAEYLDYFRTDAKTRVVAGYLEGVRNGSEFLEAARAIGREKPVIIWKAGKTDAGAKAASSHTGSLAGTDRICDAAFKQVGIIRAENLYELIDYTVAFQSPYLPRGKKVGILVEAGGGAVAAADACEVNGLVVSPLPEGIRIELQEYIRNLGAPVPATANPVDVVWPPPHIYEPVITRCFDVLFDQCDAVLWVTYSPLTDEKLASKAVETVHRVKKPLLMVAAYPTMMAKAMAAATRRGIPAFPSPERAVKALAALVQYADSH